MTALYHPRRWALLSVVPIIVLVLVMAFTLTGASAGTATYWRRNRVPH